MDMTRLAKTLASKTRVAPARIFRNLSYSSHARHAAGLGLDCSQVLQCEVSYNKYGGYCVPMSSRHRPAARKVLAREVYEPQTIEFILAHCGTGDVVHAGTYFGDFLPALARGIAPDARIWAFEPNPENYRCALITLHINSIENVRLVHAGLGSRDDTLPVRVFDEHGRSLGGASAITGLLDASATPVRIVTVDGVVPPDRQVSVLQLDVEGFEEQALRGALETIRRCLPVLILEVLAKSSLLGSAWFSDNILALGYTKARVLHGNVVFACQTDRG